MCLSLLLLLVLPILMLLSHPDDLYQARLASCCWPLKVVQLTAAEIGLPADMPLNNLEGRLSEFMKSSSQLQYPSAAPACSS